MFDNFRYMESSKTTKGKVLKGKVVSDKMSKTVVVSVDRYTKHPKYEKFIRSRKSYKAHDEAGEYKVGDVVMIGECAPYSKDKHFEVLSKVI